MKRVAIALFLALAVAPLGAADQSPDKTKQKSTQSKAQGKAKGKKTTAGTSGSPGAAGVASCSPDTTPPVIASVSATPNVLLVPNHKMNAVSIRANVTDNCAGAVTWAVTSIASDEPMNGTGEGDTQPDWGITAPHAVSLRAERAGSGDGRVYTITITARDAANNTATATTTVNVPHNR